MGQLSDQMTLATTDSDLTSVRNSASLPLGLYFKFEILKRHVETSRKKAINSLDNYDPHDVFYKLQKYGNYFVAASGAIDGNVGRTATGLMNVTRNDLWPKIRKSEWIKRKMGDEGAFILKPLLAAFTNIWQGLGAETDAEKLTSASAVSAYSLMAVRPLMEFTKKKIEKISENNEIWNKIRGCTR